MKKLDLNNNYTEREPFKVPDGYFDNLTARMMAALPEDKPTCDNITMLDNNAEADTNTKQQAAKTSFWNSDIYAKIKPYVYIAAMVATIYFGVCIYKSYVATTEQNAAALANAPQTENNDQMTEQEAYEYANDACNYIMANSYDIFACVTDDEN